jgi:hypothetical protein
MNPMKINRLLIIYFLILQGCAIHLHRRLHDSDYYIKGPKKIVEQLSDYGKNNFRGCYPKGKGEDFYYTADQVSEFGFNDGKVYLSSFITIDSLTQKVFLRRLVKGNSTLFYYAEGFHKYFFVSMNSNKLILVKKGRKNEFRKTFSELYDSCSSIKKNCFRADYTPKSLSVITEQFNNCKPGFLPVKQPGVKIGYFNDQLTPVKNSGIQYLSFIKFGNSPALMFSLYYNFPINYSRFSFQPEIGLEFNESTGSYEESGIYADAKVTSTSIVIPLIVKYMLPGPSFSMFFSSGLANNIYVKNNNTFLVASGNSNSVQIEAVIKDGLMSNFSLGYSLEVGFLIPAGVRNSIELEIRHMSFYGIGTDANINSSQTGILLGYNF